MTYNPNIPTGGQTISSTTVPIQTNFSQANIAFGVDHTAFDILPSQGQHKKVTLIQQASDPTSVTTSPILYCKSTTSNTLNNDIYFLTSGNDGGAAVQLTTSKAAPFAASSGTSFLPGGVIIQWGIGTPAPLGATIFFHTSFPNACWGVTATYNLGASTGTLLVTSILLDKFTVNGSNSTIFYIAIGN